MSVAPTTSTNTNGQFVKSTRNEILNAGALAAGHASTTGASEVPDQKEPYTCWSVFMGCLGNRSTPAAE
ncbi:unnamed protein product [Caenorhabditis sp. 36 PRJEB53466]|nr:unnamed protein product [Caenorhabditis sp. 36 PRJEB53466]